MAKGVMKFEFPDSESDDNVSAAQDGETAKAPTLPWTPTDHATWTVGYEELDASLKIKPGHTPPWAPFMRRNGEANENIWEVHPNGKKWLTARYKAYVGMPAGPEQPNFFKRYDRMFWKHSLAGFYHSLWPNLNFDDYGGKNKRKTAENRTLEFLRKLFKDDERKIKEANMKCPDLFFASVLADSHRPHAYNLWSASLSDDVDFKESVDRQLKRLYGSAEGRSLNEWSTACRTLFEKLSAKEQEIYNERAECWKFGASGPRSEDTFSWTPAAFNALGDVCDKKGQLVSMTFVGGKGPDGKVYYHINECSSHSRGPVTPILERERGASMCRVWRSFVAEVQSHLTGSTVEAEDVYLLQTVIPAASDQVEGGVRPPDLEHNNSFTKLAPELDQARIRSEVSRYLNETWMRVPVAHRGMLASPPWHEIVQLEGNALLTYYEPQRVPDHTMFTSPASLHPAVLRKLALHLIRSCKDPMMDDKKRFRWAHQVADDINDEAHSTDSEDSEDDGGRNKGPKKGFNGNDKMNGRGKEAKGGSNSVKALPRTTRIIGPAGIAKKGRVAKPGQASMPKRPPRQASPNGKFERRGDLLTTFHDDKFDDWNEEMQVAMG